MKNLIYILLLLLLTGCSTATTIYTKKVSVQESNKVINCHDYKRTTKIKITTITEVYDEMVPYDDDQKPQIYHIREIQDKITVE